MGFLSAMKNQGHMIWANLIRCRITAKGFPFLHQKGLKQDNQRYGRPERAALIEKRIKQNQKTEIPPTGTAGREGREKDSGLSS